MNNTTLIIDGNWFLLSRYAVMSKEFTETDEVLLKTAQEHLVDKMAASINRIINYFNGFIDNLLIVQDKGSWRKKLEKPALYKEVDYKGTRVADSNTQWEYVWKSLDKLITTCKEHNITCTSEYLVEGDDWIWFWTKYLNKNNTNAIIWTSDGDLKQLINITDTAWTVWYNDHLGMCVNSNYNNEDILLNPFSNSISLSNLIKYVNNTGNKIYFINPFDIISTKIMCGDNSDNIKAVIFKKSGSRTYKISEKEWLSIKNALKITDLDIFNENLDNIINAAKQLKRFNTIETDNNIIRDAILYNEKLVYLDHSSYPESVYESMLLQKDNYQVTDLEYIKNNYKVLSENNSDILKIFENI